VKTYSVWVGGGEVNSHYLNRSDAERIASAWRSMGYDDAVVEEVVNA
jgi:hypothetical protein